MCTLFSKRTVMLPVYIFIILLLASSLAIASDANDTTPSGFSFNLYDEHKSPLSNILVKIFLENKDTGKVIRFTDYLSDNLAYIELEKGDYIVTVFADDLTTEGKDYYLQKSIKLDKEVIEINLLPVGTIHGVVLDQLDNVVDSALLNFHCSDYGAIAPNSSDELGFFIYNYAAIGSCMITTGYGSAVGSADVIVNKGEISTIEIKLDKTLVDIKNPEKPIKPAAYIFLALAAIVVFLVLVFFITGISKKRKEKKIVQVKETEPKAEMEEKSADSQSTDSKGVLDVEQSSTSSSLTSSQAQMKEETSAEAEEKEAKPDIFELNDKAKSIIETLDESEKEIVNFMVKENGKTTQSRVYYETGIPRTSLYRCMQRLESRNIIKIKKIGKVKKIEFTDFFLDKEEKQG